MRWGEVLLLLLILFESGCTAAVWQPVYEPSLSLPSIVGVVPADTTTANSKPAVVVSYESIDVWNECRRNVAVPLNGPGQTHASMIVTIDATDVNGVVAGLTPQQRQALHQLRFKYADFSQGDHFMRPGLHVSPVPGTKDCPNPDIIGMNAEAISCCLFPLDANGLPLDWPYTSDKNPQLPPGTRAVLLVPEEILRPAGERMTDVGVAIVLTPPALVFDTFVSAPICIVWVALGLHP